MANKSGKLGFGLETMELLRLSVRTDWKGAKVLEAGSGRKIVLKECVRHPSANGCPHADSQKLQFKDVLA